MNKEINNVKTKKRTSGLDDIEDFDSPSTSIKRVNFTAPGLCSGSAPVSCRIDGNDYQVDGSWGDLFITLIEHFMIEFPVHFKRLFTRGLLPGSHRPFFLKKKPKGSARKLSNGYWVYINYSIQSLVNLIGKLCEFSEINLDNVVIFYVSKELKTGHINVAVNKKQITLTSRETKTEPTQRVFDTGFWDDNVKLKFRQWLRSETYAQRTIENYCCAITRIFKSFSDLFQKALTNSDNESETIRKYIELLKKSKKFVEINHTRHNQLTAALVALECFYASTVTMNDDTTQEIVIVGSKGKRPVVHADKESIYSDSNVTESLEQSINTLRVTISQSFSSGINFCQTVEMLLKSETGITLDDVMRCKLMSLMFTRKDGRWLFPEMVADMGTITDMIQKADQLLEEYWLFELEILYDLYRQDLCNLPEQISDFLLFVEAFVIPRMSVPYIIVRLKKHCFVTRNMKQGELLEFLIKEIQSKLQEADDFIEVTRLVQSLPYLSRQVIESVIEEYIPSAIPGNEANEIPEWKIFDKFYFPEGLSNDITCIVQSIENTDTIASLKTIEEELNSRYHCNIRENYGLTKKQFKKVVAFCYRGMPQHDWKKELFIPNDSIASVNLFDEFKKTTHGIFHESEFFEFLKKQGIKIRSSIVTNYLVPNCIRIDRNRWVLPHLFFEESKMTEQDCEQIGQRLLDRMANKPFLSLGNLPDFFFESLPTIVFRGNFICWNAFLISSICLHMINNLRVENYNVCAYVTTSVIVPNDADVGEGIVVYALEYYKHMKIPYKSIDDIFKFLKEHKVRLKLTESVAAKIKQVFELGK